MREREFVKLIKSKMMSDEAIDKFRKDNWRLSKNSVKNARELMWKDGMSMISEKPHDSNYYFSLNVAGQNSSLIL
jgi:hypothetical protein